MTSVPVCNALVETFSKIRGFCKLSVLELLDDGRVSKLL